MRARISALLAATLILAPAAASAQYYGGDFDRRGRDVHVDRYHHGDHDDIVVHRHRRHYEERPSTTSAATTITTTITTTIEARTSSRATRHVRVALNRS